MVRSVVTKVMWVGRARTLTLGVAAMVAAALAASLLILAVATRPAEAAFPGTAGAIAFSTSRDGSAQIYRMNADGFGQTRLTDAAGNSFSPAWSADGKKIAFASPPASGRTDVWLMDANGDNEVNLTNNGNAASDEEPSWFPSGEKIAYQSDANNSTLAYDIWVMTLNAAGNAPIGFLRLTTHAEPDSSPAVSPDGKKVAFVSTRDGDHEIYVMKATATEGPTNRPKKLTNNGAFAPHWSPNGTKIVFSSGRTGNFEIFVMNADGTKEKNVTQRAGHQEAPAYSPDGKKIAYTEGFLSPDVWRMRSDGSNPVQLTNNTVFDGEPSWQPIP